MNGLLAPVSGSVKAVHVYVDMWVFSSILISRVRGYRLPPVAVGVSLLI